MDTVGRAEPAPAAAVVVMLLVLVLVVAQLVLVLVVVQRVGRQGVSLQVVVYLPPRRETYWRDKDTENLVDSGELILKIQRPRRLHVLNSLSVRVVSLRAN